MDGELRPREHRSAPAARDRHALPGRHLTPPIIFDYSITHGIKHVDLDGHWYPVPPGLYPSITTVNAAMADRSFLVDWRKRIGDAEADRISFEARDRGSIAHAYVEARYNLDPTNEDSVFAFQRIARDMQQKYGLTGTAMAENLWRASSASCSVPIAQEVALWSEELEVAGRCDAIGVWNGTLSVIDYKTSRKFKRPEWIEDYFIQVTAYGMMHDELFGTDITQGVILITVENRPPQTFVFDMRPWRDTVRERCADFHRLEWSRYGITEECVAA